MPRLKGYTRVRNGADLVGGIDPLEIDRDPKGQNVDIATRAVALVQKLDQSCLLALGTTGSDVWLQGSAQICTDPAGNCTGNWHLFYSCKLKRSSLNQPCRKPLYYG